MWILLVFIIGYHDSMSQLSTEFSSRESCVAAAEEYKARISMLPSNHKIVVLCAKK